MTEFYDLLVQLRRCSEGRCRGCPRSHAEGCRKSVSTEAADAIDELQKRLDAVSADNDSLCEQLSEYHKYDSFLAVHGFFQEPPKEET